MFQRHHCPAISKVSTNGFLFKSHSRGSIFCHAIFFIRTYSRVIVPLYSHRIFACRFGFWRPRDFARFRIPSTLYRSLLYLVKVSELDGVRSIGFAARAAKTRDISPENSTRPFSRLVYNNALAVVSSWKAIRVHHGRKFVVDMGLIYFSYTNSRQICRFYHGIC